MYQRYTKERNFKNLAIQKVNYEKCLELISEMNYLQIKDKMGLTKMLNYKVTF